MTTVSIAKNGAPGVEHAGGRRQADQHHAAGQLHLPTARAGTSDQTDMSTIAS
jgi:hypothetical protein